jgi:hypothetical protein
MPHSPTRRLPTKQDIGLVYTTPLRVVVVAMVTLLRTPPRKLLLDMVALKGVILVLVVALIPFVSPFFLLYHTFFPHQLVLCRELHGL